MNVVIVHYHLNPGGVTRIIESQVKGIHNVSEGTELTVLCGYDDGTANLPGALIQVDGSLNYSTTSLSAGHFEEEVEKITACIKRHLTDKAILHCHNPNLGKNPALTLAVYKLALEGYPVVNHCHDFPEDRQVNLDCLEKFIPASSKLPLSHILYPHLARYHFITLNSCDYNHILERGMPVSRVHLVPNPVSLSKLIIQADKPAIKKKICEVLGFKSSKKICTYPVRAIERKNLGEFILVAALFAEVAQFTVTLPPKNPLEMPRYNHWKNFCLEKGIAMKFESGKKVNHEELINISDFCITTSIREGFGMVYLEPWLAGTPVIGRDLPCVTADLKGHGVEFPRLYTNILIETKDGMVDFKDLKLEDQQKVITEVAFQKSSGLKLFRDNPFLVNFLDDFPPEIIFKNQNIVKDEFTVEKYGRKLLAIYNEISQ